MSIEKTWIWIDPTVIRAIHDEQLAEHGGAQGLRDEALLESALARPMQVAAYGEPDVACDMRIDHARRRGWAVH